MTHGQIKTKKIATNAWMASTKIWNEHKTKFKFELEVSGKTEQDAIDRLKKSLEEDRITIIQVCKTDCDNKPIHVKIGGKEHTFCCQKGFEKSLKDFAKTQGGKS